MASNSATIDFTSGIDSTYDMYMISFINVLPASDGQYLRAHLYIDGNKEDDSGDYRYHAIKPTDGANDYSGIGSDSSDYLYVTNSLGDAAGEHGSGYIHLYAPSATNARTALRVLTVGLGTGGASHNTIVAQHYASGLEACTGISFFFNSANIERGTFTLYGLKN